MKIGKAALGNLEPEPDFDLAPPGASALFEALRGVGYRPWTAVADLIDNSIAAKARNVHVDFVWKAASSFVRILDDGQGMDEQALVDAMRPGSRSPAEVRPLGDLGRFGLGLKTASLSQCRSVTVVSRRSGSTALRRWDLDYVAKVDDWRLLKTLPDEVAGEELVPTEFRSGTAVVWTKLDRLIGTATGKNAREHFLDVARQVECQLAMTFHRFLEGPRPDLNLLINGNKVEPWDPFMQLHRATNPTPVDTIVTPAGEVTVQGFVLPHKDRLSPAEFQSAAGPEGWLAHQGFFIYRNRRLLVPGGWLSLGKGRRWVRDEVHRLARIQLDLANSSDEEWKIDIKKAAATPPSGIKDRLQGLAERVRADAREVFAHRGGRGSRSPKTIVRAWKSVESKGGVIYRIDRNHPSVRRVFEGDSDSQAIEDMLRILEATVPVQRIWLDVAEKEEMPAARENLDSGLMTSLRSLYAHMIHGLNLEPQQARARLLMIEPFSQFPAIVNSLQEDV